ncbi:DUF2635 domain-containing protein [Cupriavidus basilensis]|uniref:DUF2635 domain-containing protein n=1 Tax=Cupriavidus basilensis TaxID=68895 RepID=A0A643G4D2_9BURK|nr:DUF2635 domain-containing protein [Cupriavidus basilensis]QOT75057.1 DUF2635 domain-containing protein [Cupriavidus basilensis]
MKIKPAPGLKVRDPVTKQFIGDEHEADERDLYWHCRLRDGDVVPADSQEEPVDPVTSRNSGAKA